MCVSVWAGRWVHACQCVSGYICVSVCGWINGYMSVCRWVSGYMSVCRWVNGYMSVCRLVSGYMSVSG